MPIDKEKKRQREARWREAHREEKRQRDAQYRAQHREERKEYFLNYYQEQHEKRLSSARLSHSNEAYQTRQKEYLKTYSPKRRLQEREKLLDALGRKCMRCGYDADVRALQIDHVNGGGTQERKQFSNLQVYYTYILQNAASGKYQVLCANCNAIKRMEEREHRKLHKTKEGNDDL